MNSPYARQLDEAISSGNISIASANGTGSTNSVTGRLRNNTANEINLNVFVNSGMYLSNSGAGQNMLVLAVVLEGGRYYSSGTISYISLPANSTTNVRFDAFCTNRKKDTPLTNESFTRSAIPSSLQQIAAALSRYYAANFGKDISTPVQLALWRNQRESVADIASIYKFTEEDWKASSSILGVPDIPVPGISGTYSYGSDYSVTFTGNNFSMVWENRTHTGTFMVIETTIILNMTSGERTIFTYQSPDAIRDREGDLWRRR